MTDKSGIVDPLDEPILGAVPVFARLAMGTERLVLYITSSGLVVGRVGKRGAGAIVGMSFFGKLSSALEDLVKGGKETIGRREKRSSTAREVLRENKDNFFLSSNDIVRLELDASVVPVSMLLLTRSEKFQLGTSMPAVSLESLLRKALSDKLVLTRAPS